MLNDLKQMQIHIFNKRLWIFIYDLPLANLHRAVERKFIKLQILLKLATN